MHPVFDDTKEAFVARVADSALVLLSEPSISPVEVSAATAHISGQVTSAIYLPMVSSLVSGASSR